MTEPLPTRDRILREIQAKYSRRDAQLSAWASTNVIAQIGDDEWAEMHAGTCGICDADRARKCACGWRCESCKPGAS